MIPTLSIPARIGYWEVTSDGRQLTLRKGKQTNTVALERLQHCIVSRDVGYEFHLLTKDGADLQFLVKQPGEAKAVFDYLEPFCPGFRNTPTTYRPRSWVIGLEHCRLDRRELAVDQPTFFKKTLKPYLRVPVEELVWVTQTHCDHDPESPESYHICLYTTRGKSFTLMASDVVDCYRLARIFKENAPQLRYTVECYAAVK